MSARHETVTSDRETRTAAGPATLTDVITAVAAHRPGLSATKQQLLLFFCQGHHLAHTGKALFDAPLYATDQGVRAEGLVGGPAVLGTAHLNTVGWVVNRYGDLSPCDLRTLIRASTPWQLAVRLVEPRIEGAWLRVWFSRPAEVNDPDGDRPTRDQLATWAARRSASAGPR